MNKLILSALVASTVIGLNIGSAAAATVTGNNGSNVHITGCSDLASAVNNNNGSNVHITVDGSCNINQALGNATITGNNGSNIHIDGGCTDGSQIQTANNNGSNIHVTASGTCKVTTQTPVANTPAPVQTSAAPVAPSTVTRELVTSKSAPAPAALPNTGPGQTIALFAATSIVASLGYSLVRRKLAA